MIATGTAHSVRECLEIAFDQAGLEIDEHVVIDSLVRPAEVDHLIGDAAKAAASSVGAAASFEQLIRMMVDADRKLLEQVMGTHPTFGRQCVVPGAGRRVRALEGR